MVYQRTADGSAAVVSCDRGGASGSVVARWAQPEDALPPCRHSSSCFPRSEAIPRMRAMNKSEEERSNGRAITILWTRR